jgi:glucan endo-1,3-beta-D-glucosidase
VPCIILSTPQSLKSSLEQPYYIMRTFLTLLTSSLLLGPVSSTIYTGFNYGAFWGVSSNVKKADDFRDGFNMAKNLSTGVQFNSARLFTCKEQGTVDDPTGAFDAAVDTKTNLLLGFWMSPQKRGDLLDDIIKNELSALKKGFDKHGQKLSDLIIGLSVGSEDIYRWEDTYDVGVPGKDITAAIKKVKAAIASSSFAKYMDGKPIGHVDTAKHAVVEGADFYGMTAYPYWANELITNGKESFLGSLNNVKLRANNTPVWIAEMGWPFEGAQQGQAVASVENLQQYWTEVGCSVIGMYTTFWFELIKDSEAGQPDWGILDAANHKPRIDLTCPGLPHEPSASATSANSPPVAPSTLLSASISTTNGQSTMHVTKTIMVTVPPSTVPLASTNTAEETVTTTVTSTVIVTPSLSSLITSSFNSTTSSSASSTAKVTSAPSAGVPQSNVPSCITVADVAWDGQYIPVAGNPAGSDGKCSTPPAYTGLPYGSSQSTSASSTSTVLAVSASSSAVESASTAHPAASHKH